MLSKLSATEKDIFCTFVAERYPISQCVNKFYEAVPDAHKYHKDLFYKFLKSEEGIHGVEEKVERLREEATTQSYASRGSRVHSLVEIAEGLLNKLRSFQKAQVGTKEYLLVSSEFRNTLRDIKSEVEILGIGDSSALDIFTSFAKLVDEQIPSFVRRSLKQDTSSETIQ